MQIQHHSCKIKKSNVNVSELVQDEDDQRFVYFVRRLAPSQQDPEYQHSRDKNNIRKMVLTMLAAESK